MKHSFEIEIRETEGRDPELHGTVLQEGAGGIPEKRTIHPGECSNGRPKGSPYCRNIADLLKAGRYLFVNVTGG